MRLEFDQLVASAIEASRDDGVERLRPIIEKEVLHHAIFVALEKGGFLNDLTFQGGTSLRLCRGSQRYSEDLDFAGGADFNATQASALSECVQDSINSQFGLDVNIKDPKSLRKGVVSSGERSSIGVGITVDTWQVSVTTRPERRDLPRQRVKLEVANVPAYTRELVPLTPNYNLPVAYTGHSILVSCESLAEIAADKLVSLANCEHIRYRDIWDLVWLSQRKAGLTSECSLDTHETVVSLVENKLGDYSVTDFDQRIERLRENLGDIIAGGTFQSEMGRFLSQRAIEGTLNNQGFLDYVHANLDEMYSTLDEALSNGLSAPAFSM